MAEAVRAEGIRAEVGNGWGSKGWGNKGWGSKGWGRKGIGNKGCSEAHSTDWWCESKGPPAGAAGESGKRRPRAGEAIHLALSLGPPSPVGKPGRENINQIAESDPWFDCCFGDRLPFKQAHLFSVALYLGCWGHVILLKHSCAELVTGLKGEPAVRRRRPTPHLQFPSPTPVWHPWGTGLTRGSRTPWLGISVRSF